MYCRYFLCRLSLIFLPMFLAQAPIQAANESSYVSCELKGQLGNQLFEIAAALAYAWDYDLEPIFPELNKGEWNIYYNRDSIFFRLNASPLPRPPLSQFYEPSCYQDHPEKPSFHRDQYLHGYFQSWIHFHHQRSRLLEIFAPSKEVESYLENKYADLLAHPNSVAVHVRTFNEVAHHDRVSPFLGLDYYQQAINLFPEDALFVLFSDRINWCKHHFKEFNRNIVYIEDNDHVQDLFLMAKLKHHIIANSTFSWWGAYLNTNPHQIVVAPRFWMNPLLRHFPLEHPNAFYLPSWIIVDSDCNKAPYPEDIRQYDASSKSIDNQ